MAKPTWMEWADLAAKWMVPIAVVVGGAVISQNANEGRDRDTRLQSCIDKQFKLFDSVCAGNDCASAGEAKTKSLTLLAGAVKEVCKGTPFESVTAVDQAVKTLAVSTRGDIAQKGNLIAAVVGAPLQNQSKADVDRILVDSIRLDASLPPAAASGSRALDPRLYVQIGDQQQRGPAKLLISKLNGAPFVGGKLLALGPDLQTPVHQTQLRCTKIVDCASADALASYISGVLGQPVSVVNLSRKYETSPKVRANHYELWIAPGPIKVAGTPLADGIVGPAAAAAIAVVDQAN